MTTDLDADTKGELIDLLTLSRMLMAEQHIEESHIRVILTTRSEDADVDRATLMTMAVSTLASSLLTDRVNEFIAIVNDRIAAANDDTEEEE